MRKTYKKVISLCAVLIFALALIPVHSFAIGDPFSAVAVGGITGASGGGLFGAMAGASGISIGFSSGSTANDIDALWDKTNSDSVYFSGEKGQVTEPDPVTGIPTVYDYITVDIGDWLQAQQDYISEFASQQQVSDNDSGSFSYSTNGGLPTGQYLAYFKLPTSGNTSNPYPGLTISNNNNHVNFVFNCNGVTYTINNGNYYNRDFKLSSGTPSYHYFSVLYDNGSSYAKFEPSTTYGNTNGSWTSGLVNLGVFDYYNSPRVKIPASSWSPSDPTDWSVSEFLGELTNKVADGTQENIIIDDSANPPVPPVPPVPSTPLGDVPTDEWYDLFGLPVLEGQEEIHQDLQDFNDSVTDDLSDIGDQLDDANDSLGSIDTNIQTGNGLLGDLKTLGQNILSTLNSILTGVTDLVQEIVLSTETFIAGLLNSIMGGLGGWLSTMRDAFSIWHYVVEWIGSISTVFSWFWSVAGSTSYYIQLPIYASLAGAVVLAFYKRFGK